ncbi:MAG TPA: ribosome maturation factor RimM [Abditibacteriaceae bacterium]|nr:ribosome maturation factor RimM [Abditibacteriaceae bacterium]
MSDDLTTWNVLVGRVSGRWDKASLKVQPFSTTPGRFEAGARLCAARGDQRQLLNVRSARRSGHAWLVDCGLSTPEAAEAFKGARLFVHPSMRPPLPPGEFYLDELLGLRVRTEAGEDWGEIEEVLETPAHDIYVTPLAMIPGHAAFVVETDFENKVLVVRDMPGLKTADAPS